MKNTCLFISIWIVLLLTGCASIEGDPLEGTAWELYAISKGRPIEGTTITISFEDGIASGTSGCNSYSGDYQLRGDEIEFGMMASTLMACLEPGRMEQETTFLRFLGKVREYDLVDGQLQLFRADGEALTFIPLK